MSRKWGKITHKRENLNNNKCTQKDKQLFTSEKQKPTIRQHSPLTRMAKIKLFNYTKYQQEYKATVTFKH